VSKQKLLELAEEISELNNKIRKVFNEGLKEYAEEIFKKNPKLKRFSWTQYTPYFNDGSPCEFGINGDYPRVEFEGSDGMVDIDWELIKNSGTYQEPKYYISDTYKDLISLEEAQKIQADIHDFICDAIYPFENQVQSLLGEGEVIVTPSGIEVEDYDHD
jgi:hypothetical protein